MDYYKEIKNKLIDNETYCRVKDYSKERNTIITYFEIGKLLNEAGGKYGDSIIENYSNRLIYDVGTKYNKRTLFRMKQFYVIFSDIKVSTLWTQLTWSHIRLLFSLDIDSINYYLNIAKNNNLSVRDLEKKIKSKEHTRLSLEVKNKINNIDKLQMKDIIPNPLIIKNKQKIDILTEKALHLLILEDIESFLKELGNGFCYIASEYRIKIGQKYNYIDLLLFNIKYNCYVVVELKVTELKKEHIGQIEVYMNYIDENLKTPILGKTIGIIICKQDNKYVIKYCSDSRIISREYKLI